MTTKEYIEQIRDIIESKVFHERLHKTLLNFPNLKLENHIRNALVEFYNDKHHLEARAFAEHPRYTDSNTNNRISVDFSVCKQREVKFTMEIKYHFPKDYTQFAKYSRKVLQKDFYGRIYNKEKSKVNALLFVICEINKAEMVEFEKKWDLNKLSNYQLIGVSNKWQNNIGKLFEETKTELNCETTPIKNLTINGDFTTNFNFYALSSI